MDLTTRDRARLSIGFEVTSTAQDDRIDQAISLVSAQVQQLLDRFVELTTHIQFFDVFPGQAAFQLQGIPITSITTVENDFNRIFGSGTEVDVGNFAVDSKSGVLQLDRIWPVWGPQVMKITYVGGMAADTAAFIAAFPEIAGLVDMQVGHVLSHTFRHGSEDFEPPDFTFWMSGVRNALMMHRRRTLL